MAYRVRRRKRNAFKINREWVYNLAKGWDSNEYASYKGLRDSREIKDRSNKW